MSNPIIKKKLALFLNTCELGGAERSVIEQMRLISVDYDITFFIPNNQMLSETSAICNLLIKNKQNDFRFFWYPQMLYQFSRSSKLSSFFQLILVIPLLIIAYLRLPSLYQYDIVYANGTKVALFTFLRLFFSKFKGVFVWHFRDYPMYSLYFRCIDFFFKVKRGFKTFLLGNSFSVEEEIRKIFKNGDKCGFVYNPVETGLCRKNVEGKKMKTIGVVAMFTPWKGIHDIILFSSIYFSRLKELGIERINIYGKNIYKTSGDHLGYEDQLKKLKNKIGADMINFEGGKNPTEIFNEIDLLIHPSIKKEPFGRVIFEAFRSGIPVISTGLGGAKELVIPDQTGHLFNKNDLERLFLLIKKLVSSESESRRIIECAREFEMTISNSVKERLKNFLEGLDFEQETESGKNRFIGS